MKDLNIVTLNIPFPPDYGGMIDCFYRIKYLKAEGINIHLHCFEYGRSRSEELESLCKTVTYYPRNATLLNHLSKIPYIVKSRSSGRLLENLKSNDFPILFDGLHTTYYLNHPDFADRKRSVRLHNMEHLYYKSLADSETNFIKKMYFSLEAIKLRKYEERTLSSVSLLPISGHDLDSFSGYNTKVVLLPPFHPYEEIISSTGKGEYILFHGDLSVNENSLIACSLIKNVFSRLKYSCIIAGKKPSRTLLRDADGVKQLRVIADPGQNEMEDLIRNAHINVLPALTTNGFKLKHLYAFFAGRFCIVNSRAAQNYEDRSLFHIADSDKDIIRTINQLMLIDFPSDIISNRKNYLEKTFSNKINAQKLAEVIFG